MKLVRLPLTLLTLLSIPLAIAFISLDVGPNPLELTELTELTETNGNALFLAACSSGDLAQAQMLYNTILIDPRTQNDHPIRQAALHGHTQLVTWLISLGAKPAACLLEAVEGGHVATLKLLLDQPKVFPGKSDSKAIYMAACSNQGQILALLLERYPHSLGLVGDFAFDNAIRMNHLNAFKALLRDGRVQVGAYDSFYLRLACEEGRAEMVALLLQDPRLDLSAGKSMNESLLLAASQGHAGILKNLLAAGLDPTAKDCKALRRAITSGHLAVVEILLKDNRVVPTSKFNAAISSALKSGHTATADMALSHPDVSLYWNVPRKNSGKRLLAKSKSLLKSPRTKGYKAPPAEIMSLNKNSSTDSPLLSLSDLSDS